MGDYMGDTEDNMIRYYSRVPLEKRLKMFDLHLNRKNKAWVAMQRGEDGAVERFLAFQDRFNWVSFVMYRVRQIECDRHGLFRMPGEFVIP